MAHFKSPNYTQTPNELFDEHLKDMSEAELRVTLAVIRRTFGWKQHSVPLSLSELENITGLSRQGVMNGVKAAQQRGLIARTTRGKISLWVVNDAEHATSQPSRPPLVNLVDHPEDTASQPSRPPLVNVVDRSGNLSSIFKKKKERKHISATADAVDQPEPTDTETVPSPSYLTKRKRQLTGFLLEGFHEFLTAFGFGKGKAEAADAYLDLSWSAPLRKTNTATPDDEALQQKILSAARREAEARRELLRRNPDGKFKWPQGWLSGRRFEDAAGVDVPPSRSVNAEWEGYQTGWYKSPAQGDGR